MRILIYGWGQLAASAVNELAEYGREITVLGKERSQLERLSGNPGVAVVLLTEPVMQDYLLEAGISHTDVFLPSRTMTMRICCWPKLPGRCSMFLTSCAMSRAPNFRSCTPLWA